MTRPWPALLSLVTVVGLGVGSHMLYADYSRAQAQVQETTQVTQPVRRDTYWRQARLRRVVDGDTADVVVDLGYGVQIGHDSRLPIRLRLLGLDTPERTGGTAETRRQAAEATAFATAWFAGCGPGEEWPLNIRTERDDSFGRYLAEVECVTGQSLNAELLANGHAVPYP